METSTSKCTTFALFINERLNGMAKLEPYYTNGLTVMGKALPQDALPPTRAAIAKLCAECEDGVLLAKFSKGEVTVMNLLKKIEGNKQAEELLWKYIANHYQQVFEQLQQDPGIKVYYRKSNSSVVYSHDAVSVSPASANPHYSFKLTPQGLSYRFRFRCGNETIGMKAENENTLTVLSKSSPCLFVLNNRLCSTTRISHKAIAAMAKKGFILVPPEKVKMYLETFVAKLLQTETIDCDGFEVDYADRTMQATLATTTDAFGHPALRVTFNYQGEEVPSHTPQKHKVELEEREGTYHFTVVRRNFEEEDRLMAILAKLGAMPNGECLYTAGAEATARLMANEEVRNNFNIAQDYQITTNVDEKEDWFDVKMQVCVRGFMIPFSKFRSHIKNRQSSYQLPDGTIFHIPLEWFACYADLFEKARDKGETLQLDKRFAGLIADESAVARDYLEQLTQGDENVPEKVNATLRHYQKAGYNYLLSLYRHGTGGCLADDMGLGKTLQFITFFAKVYEGEEGKRRTATTTPTASRPWRYATATPSLFDQMLDEEPVANSEAPAPQTAGTKRAASLVVVPTTVLFNWQKELQKFAPHLHYSVHYGPRRLSRIGPDTFNPYHLVLTTYSILQRDSGILANYHFECAVLDESHTIKNPNSQVHAAAKAINANCGYVITGTPIENSLNDLWAQFSFACPGLLGTYGSFCSTYQPSSSERLEKLRKMVKPYILRRTKKEVCTDLPELTRTDIWIEMGDREKKAYDLEKSAARNTLLGIEGQKNALHVLQQLTRLRQLACDPTMLPQHASLASAKRQAVVELADELHQSENKVLLFSSFVKQLELIAADFKKNGITFEMLTGADDGTLRQRKVERFQSDKRLTCLLVSLKAGSTGINLTAANYVFLLSPWWNPFAEQQAIDRAYRIGQQNNVMVYNFVTKDTVEEKILHLQEKKRQLSNAVIDAGNPLQNLTAEEMEELL